MKKLLTLVIAALFTITLAHAQAGWVDHKADNRISIKFPVEPKELTPGSFMVKDNDGIVYVFTVVDFVKVAGIDSVALAPMKDTPKFASQLKTGMKGSLPDVELADFTIGKWKGFTSYTSSGKDSKKLKYDMFMFIIGNKLYSLSTVAHEETGTKGRDDFYSSIVLSN
jgi:hypothetical protein